MARYSTNWPGRIAEGGAGVVEAVLESACRVAGLDRSSVGSARPIGGGCINNALRVRTAGGDFCLKWNAGVDRDFFRMEAEGLSALADSGAVDVPRVIALGRDEDEVPWLLLEWIHEARATAHTWRQLGRRLVRLHRTREHPSMPAEHATDFGWHSDNVIGSLTQPNRWMDDGRYSGPNCASCRSHGSWVATEPCRGAGSRWWNGLRPG